MSGVKEAFCGGAFEEGGKHEALVREAKHDREILEFLRRMWRLRIAETPGGLARFWHAGWPSKRTDTPTGGDRYAS